MPELLASSRVEGGGVGWGVCQGRARRWEGKQCCFPTIWQRMPDKTDSCATSEKHRIPAATVVYRLQQHVYEKSEQRGKRLKLR